MGHARRNATRDLEEKELRLDATVGPKEKLEGAISGDDDLIIHTELVGGVGKYGRLLGGCIGDDDLSLNELIEGYAWAYDGELNKRKRFREELRETPIFVFGFAILLTLRDRVHLARAILTVISNLKSKNVKQEFTNEQVAEILKCSEDPVYFIRDIYQNRFFG